MINSNRLTLAALMVVSNFLFLSANAQSISTVGPKIPRVVARRPQPVFEPVGHLAAGPGRKIVAIEVPDQLKVAFEKDQVYAAITFSAPRPTDNCNQTKIYGAVAESDVPGTTDLKYGVLEIKPTRISKTLKECNEVKHEVRAVEIVTELRGPSPFRDTLVFDVPEDVEVAATFWSPIATAAAVKVD